MERCLAEGSRRLRGESGSIGELWQQERPHLLPLPAHPFPCCRTVSVRPNRLSMVTFETNRYSVPVEHARHALFLRAFVDRVELTDGTQAIATHRRCYGREEDILDPLHYLPLLREHPGALDHAKAFRGWPHPPALDRYRVVLEDRLPSRIATLHFIEAVNASLEVLDLVRTYPLEEVAAAVDRALATGSVVPGTVTYFLRAHHTATASPSPVLLATAPPCLSVQDRALRQYNLLLTR